MSATVLVLEDDPSIRELIEDVLEEAGVKAHPCDSPEQAIQMAGELGSALLVADFWGVSHHDLASNEREEIVRLAEAVPTIMVTARAWAGHQTASDMGLVALVRKPFDVDDLRQIVADWIARLAADSKAAKAQAWELRRRVDTAVEQVRVAHAELRRVARRQSVLKLTPRQRQLAALVAEGLTNVEIAERLALTPGTVSSRLAQIQQRIDVRNRVQIAAWAVEHGLYRAEPT
jgi:DNA-binding NarL/FixJ family response regulator